MKTKNKFVKRTVGYWLICGGTLHHGARSGGIIRPDEEHLYCAQPYTVRCAECVKKENLR